MVISSSRKGIEEHTEPAKRLCQVVGGDLTTLSKDYEPVRAVPVLHDVQVLMDLAV